MANPNTIRQQNFKNKLFNEIEKDEWVGFDTGIHDFSFQFKLPIEDIYSSFDVKNSAGYIRYNIIVNLFFLTFWFR